MPAQAVPAAPARVVTTPAVPVTATPARVMTTPVVLAPVQVSAMPATAAPVRLVLPTLAVPSQTALVRVKSKTAMPAPAVTGHAILAVEVVPTVRAMSAVRDVPALVQVLPTPTLSVPAVPASAVTALAQPIAHTVDKSEMKCLDISRYKKDRDYDTHYRRRIKGAILQYLRKYPHFLEQISKYSDINIINNISVLRAWANSFQRPVGKEQINHYVWYARHSRVSIFLDEKKRRDKCREELKRLQLERDIERKKAKNQARLVEHRRALCYRRGIKF
ncbi:hypothetical protein BJ508DRAFT_313502 [Ascobolus immersus RN42]|uniref:Uncharacterized protein n=1 Tax=Ascobolus immersus RN42 TaxID=1160509 RepID=A0A3N4HVV8_ASCIM|nr:hypothetical protein BJ508DRAFT_313502 [Ascobolus immersus RN42]